MIDSISSRTFDGYEDNQVLGGYELKTVEKEKIHASLDTNTLADSELAYVIITVEENKDAANSYVECKFTVEIEEHMLL